MSHRFQSRISEPHNSNYSPTSKNRENILFPQTKKRLFCETDLFDSFSYKKEIKDLISNEVNVIRPLKRKDLMTCEPNLKETKNIALEILEKFLLLDEKFNDYDGFPCETPFVPNIINRNPISNYSVLKKIPFPEYLTSSFNDIREQEEKYFVLTGIYEKLNIIYFTKDNMIYLWNFITNEVNTYDQINAIISAIHITTPKLNFFSDEITHIMIVATNLNITILLIRQNENGLIQIIKSDFVIEIDTNYIITYIASTNQRRVFLGSQNNFLYELDYTMVKSIFFGPSKKLLFVKRTSESLVNKLLPDFLNLKTNSFCSKICVDDTRNILYALIYTVENKEKIFDLKSVNFSEIKYFTLGISGKDFREIGSIKQNEIKDRDRDSANQNDRNYIILDMFVVDRSESKYYELIAVTKLGLRAFISFNYEAMQIKMNSNELVNNFSLFPHYPKKNSFYIYLKYTPQHSINLIIEKKDNYKPKNEVKEELFYENVSYIEKAFFIFYHDRLKNNSHLNIIEQDKSLGIRIALENIDKKSSENISNLLTLQDNKRISFIVKRTHKTIYPDFLDIMKFENEEYITKYFYSPNKYINYQDSLDHYSNKSMHIYANQQFLSLEELIVSTSSELVIFGKLRPIDLLYELIHDKKENDEIVWTQIQAFINEHTIYETLYMLLIIITNKKFTFYKRTLKNDEIEIKNSEKLIEFAKIIYLKINLKNKEQTKFSKSIGKEDNIFNIIGESFIESQSIKINNISYSLYMYLARIARLFLEENIFIADKSNDYYLECFKINNLHILISIIDEFERQIRSFKNDLILKMNEQQQNKMASSEENDDNKINEFINFQKDFDNIFFLTNIFRQSLTFIMIMYEVSNIRRYLSKISSGLFSRILDLKIKDIINNGSTNITIKEWIEEYFDSIITEKDTKFLNCKLEELSTKCPYIISISDREIIIANILIKHTQKSKLDDINKKEIISKAINLLMLYPESVSITKVAQIFSDSENLKEIIHIASHKCVYLKRFLDTETDSERSDETRKVKSIYYNEFKECLYYIFKILSELVQLIRSKSKEIESDSSDSIKLLHKMKDYSLDQLINLQIIYINEVIIVEEEFLHDLLFDHLSELGILGALKDLKSPFLESYLNRKINTDKKDPKKYQSLFKLQFSMKDYLKAFQTILNLINFDNNYVLNKKDYVKILDRKSYCNSALICLENLLQLIDEKLQNEYLQHKITINEIRGILTVQNLILEKCQKDFKLSKNIEFSIPLENTINLLEKNLVPINELYMISCNLRYYDLIIDTLFLMYNLKDKSAFEALLPRDICSIYETYTNFLISKENNYPTCLLTFLNKIFCENLSDVDDKEKVFQTLFPLSFLINLIELKNQSLDEKEMDYEQASQQSYDSYNNPFWLVNYLYTKANFGITRIYSLYLNIYKCHLNSYNEEEEEKELLIIHFVLCIIYILKIWFNSIQNMLSSDSTKCETLNNRTFLLDLEEFDKKKNELREFMFRSYELTTNKRVKYLIESKSLDKIRSFQKGVENKMEYLINLLLQKNRLIDLDILDTSFLQMPINPITSKEKNICEVREKMSSIGSIIEEENKNESFAKLVKSEKLKPSFYRKNNLEEEV